MMKKLVFLFTLAIISALASANTVWAMNSISGNKDDDSASVSVPLSLESTGERAANSTVPINVTVPGCYGQLDNVHLSKSAGLVSTHGRTVCSIASENFVSITQGYSGWFNERLYGLANSNKLTKGGTTAQTQVKYYCAGTGNQLWTTTGNHRATIGGKIYWASTSTSARLTC